MSDTVISIKNLSKKYRRYRSVLEGAKELLHPFGKEYHEEFWALKDISFDVKRGEVTGIIGRNGSGKSTLLQILCGILTPNAGEVSVKGRISALLELGAGFHPNFTGRENVYLSGALMGFTKKEMDERFQSIADFAEIGDFLDQPVRTYSSGMFLRLAFAAAINVAPDILIIDEALSVGDTDFQLKCLNKIEQFRVDGKNLVIVSHDIIVVKKLCDRVVFLDNGAVIYDGDPKEAVDRYFENIARQTASKSFEKAGRISHDGTGLKKIYFTDVRLCDATGKENDIFQVGQPIFVKASFDSSVKIDYPVFGGIIHSENGIYLGGFNSTSMPGSPCAVETPGEVEYRLDLNLLQGVYYLTLAIHDETGKIVYDYHDRGYRFIVKADADSLPYSGHIRIPCTWKYEAARRGSK